MIEKTTTNRNYPKPDAKNFLQDDVTRLESALDAIDTDIQTINTTKADQTALQSAIDTINTTKADKTEVDGKIEALRETVYATAYNIIGPSLAFQYSNNLTYSIEIPDAAAYAWTASGVTITSGTTSKSITVSAGTASGSVSVSVTTEAGNTLQKTKEITVKRFSNIQTFEYTGNIGSWTVPASVDLIRIVAWGAGGGDGYSGNTFGRFGGKGARMKGEFQVNPGDKLLILVGEKGGERTNTAHINGSGAGGGGSFVVKVDPDSPHQMTVGGQERVTPLIIAGGGGGGGIGNLGQVYDGGNGLTGSSGGDAFDQAGGTNGSGGEAVRYGGGGAGFSGDGTYPDGAEQPKSFLNGGQGGTYDSWSMSAGGFGGGGGSGSMPGGGGGYSGGASGGEWYSCGRSGGGGSYNAGTNQNNSEGVQAYHGRVQISW